MTGWKVGWATASAPLSEAVRMGHQFLTFCTPGALQQAVALAMEMDDSYYQGLLASYTKKRQRLCNALEALGFDVQWPQGTYFASINIADLDFEARANHPLNARHLFLALSDHRGQGGRDPGLGLLARAEWWTRSGALLLLQEG